MKNTYKLVVDGEVEYIEAKTMSKAIKKSLHNFLEEQLRNWGDRVAHDYWVEMFHDELLTTCAEMFHDGLLTSCELVGTHVDE